jgi:large subunit ribosomal protein L4
VAELEHEVVNMEGLKVGVAQLDSQVFGAPLHEKMVHAVVRYQLAKRRSGTHSTLNRERMKGGGKKPFRQKGTGHARAGSNTSPLWYGGAVIFGPTPRSYEHKVPKQVRRQALAAVLTDKERAKKLLIVDRLEVASGKTRDMKAVLDKLGVAGQRVALVVTDQEGPGSGSMLWRSSRNLKNVVMLPTSGVNVYDLLRAQVVVSTSAAIEALQGRFGAAAAAE